MNAYDVLGIAPGATLREIELAFVARLAEVRREPLLDADHDPALPVVTAFRLAMGTGAARFEASTVSPAAAPARVVETAPQGRRVPAAGFTPYVPAAA